MKKFTVATFINGQVYSKSRFSTINEMIQYAKRAEKWGEDYIVKHPTHHFMQIVSDVIGKYETEKLQIYFEDQVKYAYLDRADSVADSYPGFIADKPPGGKTGLEQIRDA